MKWIFWCWLSLVLVQLNDCQCFGCHEEERLALLKLKTSFYPDKSYAPPSWEDDDSDCCAWENVVCDKETKQVSKLFLNSSWDPLEVYEDVNLDATLFLPFKDLTSLNLSSNMFSGLADNDGFERLSKLNKLRFLDLSGGYFNDSILAHVGAISSLTTLYLASNLMTGATHFQELAALSNLEELDLSENLLESFMEIQGLKKLSKLKVLNLNSNKLNMSTLLSLGNLHSLKRLYINHNSLEGSITIDGLNSLRNLEVLDVSSSNICSNFLQVLEYMISLKGLSLRDNSLNATLDLLGLCKLRDLEELDISHNSFKGTIPSCVETLTSLRVLDISRNRFSGNISSSFISNLISLEFLSLSHNVFQSLAPFSSIANHSKLEVFELIGDNNGLMVEIDDHNWVPRFQLKIFRLSGCSVDEGSMFKFLSYQYDLRVIDLSDNNLEGDFPTWLMENNTRMVELHLKNNSFKGQFPLPCRPSTFISVVDISNNQLQGHIPSNISVYLPNLKFLNLSTNSFKGSIPSSFGDMKICSFWTCQTMNSWETYLIAWSLAAFFCML
ncbi:probable LRR receptor-like serine/threonine-protein kinase At4g36180 isoform X2 [Durio zibethinus]|uniref:Probable LRR receptor-like serine/threonine-protein kinase At4g36180 isoform X2 n=1 Tax=Durio zibethinus TaxID=66656 RepID=A0A6P5XUH9_DURZI|nr:probable LRR receptor-like serine/threonine-protein kinase At4g36180 isoform X2 [Durio zibethinus]